MQSEQSFDTGEVTLNYAEWPPNGPPLVLLHGLQGRWEGVRSLAPHLTPRWRVYAPDLRGHGKSGRVAGQYRLADYTRDVLAFLSHLAEPAVLIGHSLGAYIALAAAAASPGRTRAAVLLDPPIAGGKLDIDALPGARPFFRWVADTIEGDPAFETILARCRARMPEADEPGLTAYADQLARLDPDVLRLALDDQKLAGFDLPAALRQVRRPLLLLYGDPANGGAMGDADAAFVQSQLPSAVIGKIPEGDHMFFERHAEATMRHIDAFLSSARAEAVAGSATIAPTSPGGRRG